MIFYLKGENKVEIQKGARNKVTTHTEATESRMLLRNYTKQKTRRDKGRVRGSGGEWGGCHQRILCVEKMSFENEGEIKAFSNKQT